MIIKKYFQSCLLIEDKGKKLLIDPGSFTFIDKKVTTKDIGPADVIIITHKHLDHYYPEALKEFINMNKNTIIIANQEICFLLNQEKLPFNVINSNETKEINGFKIQAFDAKHELIPAEIPHNHAYLINDTLLHPGDSFQVEKIKADILALPIAGPWCRLTDALKLAEIIKPNLVIPIHDWVVKDFMLDRMYNMCDTNLKSKGIEFNSIKLGDSLNI